MTTFPIIGDWENDDTKHKHWEIKKKTDFRKEVMAFSSGILDFLSAKH